MKLYSTENSVHYIGFNQNDYLDIPWDNCTTIHLYQTNFYDPKNEGLTALACSLRVIKSLGLKCPRVCIHPLTAVPFHILLYTVFSKFFKIIPYKPGIVSLVPKCILENKEKLEKIIRLSIVSDYSNSEITKYIDCI